MRDPWVKNGQDLPVTPFEEQILDHPNSETIQLLVAMGFEAENVSTAIKENLQSKQALQCDRMASSIVSSICSGGDVEPLAQQALQRDSVTSIVSSICSGGDVEPLAQQALQRDSVTSIGSSTGRARKPSSVTPWPPPL
ncbi:hypothetical protein P7K49_007423 [Saguinus oedipus]|uniref:UBA domain-containing protein n=1 Tax=Saguinus oedipus TaxID=9490 RepID=A0ABQ9VUZ9_SAGOE|nr:hypothetical protein P7K49_007423 [Saguinus oedipus]